MPNTVAWDASRVKAASTKFPKPASFQPSYGTAGFRSLASVLDSTVFRCGLVTAARAIVLGQACGLMITASHNPEQDNGVKIVEPDGGMLVAAWESLSTDIARAETDDEVVALTEHLLKAHGVQVSCASNPATQPAPIVVLGCDTRPSAQQLVVAARAGVEAMGGVVMDLGQVSTPQLHFAVVALNEGKLAATTAATTQSQAHQALTLYFDTLLGGYKELVGSFPSMGDRENAPLNVDCANGVGAAQLDIAAQRLLQGTSSEHLNLHLINQGGPQGTHCGLNKGCGADFVQKEVVAPHGFESLPANARCCSIDGDADRLVYFIPGPETSGVSRRVTLLDGDKIAALAACLLRDLISGLPSELAARIKIGVVQTAYANGASTHYLEKVLGLQVLCTKTGVKHLHPAAHAFDIGIYFESNGHGTVLFSKALLQDLHQHAGSCLAARQLLAVSRAVNQTVGDALSGIFLVEAALRYRGWDLHQWQALYTDLPSKQRKLVVKDRHILVSSDPADRRIGAPEGLQQAIDVLVAQAGEQARAFVRASGTEDAVRVYAEGSTQEIADRLAVEVAQAVYDLAGGVGQRP